MASTSVRRIIGGDRTHEHGIKSSLSRVMWLKEPGELSWYSDSATGRTTEISFDCQRVQHLHQSIRTGYRTHPASYLLCSERPFTGGKADLA